MNILAKTINFYKKIQYPMWQSAVLGLFNTGCKFYPTCSEYAVESLGKKGILKGILRSFYRIIRCNPWSKGGIDLA